MGDRARGVRLTSNSPERDLALLHLDHPIKSSVPAIVIDDYAPGDDIAIVGSPDGVKFKTSYGRLSDVWVDSRMRNCDPADAVGTRNQDYLVLDASTWSGNSGGGAFDNEGRVIGIVVRVHTTSIGECKRPDDKNREYREVLLDMGGPLWGYAVAGKEVKTFLREAGL
jgi:S1-C subfamily serine protease